MRIVANKNKKSKKKFPWRIILDNGRQIPVPSQHDFKSEFIQRHGCSLVGFYMALRFRGVKKTMQQVFAVCPKEANAWSKISLNTDYKRH